MSRCDYAGGRRLSRSLGIRRIPALVSRWADAPGRRRRVVTGMAAATGHLVAQPDPSEGPLSGPSWIPRFEFEVLPRPRLWEQLDNALRCRTVLLCASAGFGKTVLCASWMSRRSPRGRPAWVTLDPEDREPARFWARVATALFGSSLQAAPVDAGHAHRDVLKRRLDELGRAPEPVTLVL